MPSSEIRPRLHLVLPGLGLLVSLVAASCSDKGSDSDSGGGGSSSSPDISLDDDSTSNAGSSNANQPWSLPSDFVAGTFGGYKLGPAIGADVDPADLIPKGEGEDGCGTTIVGVVRDMTVDHPDFEDLCCGLQQGIVEDQLGDDQKPVYAPNGSTPLTTGKAAFDQWYRTVEGVNQPFLLYLDLEPNAGIYTFHSTAFFPVDGVGFGDQGNYGHNFHFTTEIHTKFVYRGGETFRFVGDDDVFVFMNGKLVIDLGGVHGAETQEVSLDEVADSVGLVVGSVYPLDLFQAERHTSESNFRIDMTLELVDCGTVIDVPVTTR